MIVERLKLYIEEALLALGGQGINFIIEHPADLAHGDYSTNAALAAAKQLGTIPRALAGEIADHIIKKNDPEIANVEVAGAGFVNIHLSRDYFVKIIRSIDAQWGKTDTFNNKRVIVEYTDPNPFKEFHIGHLLPNTIGESLSRLVEWGGGELYRANYQGDAGMHVAKAIWGIEKNHHDMPHEEADILEKAKFLGNAYATGADAFESDPVAKEAIVKINKKIYDKSDPLINALYDNGRRWSLEYFEHIYKLLGTKFDHYFFESETAPRGEEVVRANVGEVFSESNGAIIYDGEKEGLHTRVFINSEGLPTYETKELGLAKVKYELFPYDLSYVVTGNEIADYFKLLLSVMKKVYANDQLAEKTHHVAHGMMRLTNGKISSRKGNVPTALALIDEAKEVAMEKIGIDRGFTNEEKAILAEKLAIGAVKYSILRQESGKDIIFDFKESLSFEGDSGPYLAYTYARIVSLEKKAAEMDIEVNKASAHPNINALEKLLVRFPEIVARAQHDVSPHHLVGYLTQLAREFNSFYANTTILGGGEYSSYYLDLTRAVGVTLRNGFYMLGMPVVDSM